MLRRLALVVVLSSALPLVGAAQERGLLLGLRYPLPADTLAPRSSSYAYLTLLLSNDADGTWHQTRQAGLRIPRGSVLWQADVRTSRYNAWTEAFSWAAKAGLPPEYTGISVYNGEFCEGFRSEIIHFASRDHLALEQISQGYCEDAVHPWTYHTLAVVPLDSTAHLGLSIEDVLGDDALAALTAASDQFLAALPDDDARLDYLPLPDPASWGLVRQRGRWIVRGRLDPASAILTGYADFPIDTPPPSGTAPALDPGLLRTIRTAYPSAVDAFRRADAIVLLHPDRLTLHHIRDQTLSPPEAEFPVPPRSVAVMERWSEALETVRWQRLLGPGEETAKGS